MQVSRHLSRRQRAGGGRHGRRADRAAGQRRREHALHVVAVGNDGTYNLTVTFDLGTDLNTALVMVQNRVALAMPQLPNTVQQQGITIKKKSPNILLVVSFYSPDRRYDDIYLSNYATINVKDELFRLEGVADITYLGQRDYSIRAWLDPQNAGLAQHHRRRGRAGHPAAEPGGGPRPARPAAQPGVTRLPIADRHAGPAEDARAIRRHHHQGDQRQPANMATPQIVRLHDVARVEMGAANYNQSLHPRRPPLGRPGHLSASRHQRPRRRRAHPGEDGRAEKAVSRGLDYNIGYDTTPFIRESVNDVIQTLFEAVILVAIVVLVFLQNWRAALIPLIAVPVAIVGTFAVMEALGFSLNNISLFGLVLAIGIVVDDAIVVVENVERWLEQGLPSQEAARRAMDEVTSPVLAVAIVLCAVFVPCAFISGIPGQFFRQFAVTIAVSTVISAFNSLTLSPALAALLLKPHGAPARPADAAAQLCCSAGSSALFNGSFTSGHHGLCRHRRLVAAAVRAGAAALRRTAGADLAGCSARCRPAFIPQQDQGWLLVNVQLPDSSSLQQTQAVMHRLERDRPATPRESSSRPPSAACRSC